MRQFIPFLLILAVGACAVRKYETEQSKHFPADTIMVPEVTETGKAGDTSVVVAPMKRGTDGVYFFQNGFSTLILELVNGHYRYWFSTDVKDGHEPKYPRSGKYLSDGAIVRLEHSSPSMQDIWVFRKLNDQITLWRPTAIEWWHKDRKFDSFGILYPTKLKPEDIWHKEVWKIGP